MGAVSVTVTCMGEATVVVAPCGDLTAATVVQIEPHLRPVLARRPALLVIDLSHVPTCDTTGLMLLDVTADYAGKVRLAAPAAPVCRALRHAGTMRDVATFSSVTGALDGDPLDLLATPNGGLDRIHQP